MNRALWIVVFSGFVSLGNPSPDFISCDTSESPKSCPPGTFFRENVAVHGSCPGCVSLKDEHERCLSSAECQPGLKCSTERKCERDPDQACEYYKRYDQIWNKYKYWNPECLPDGSFAPKQCKGEKMSGKCFCVDKAGRRIFGEEEWSKADNMTCGCSRLADKIQRTSLALGFHCDGFGNFEPLQCHQKVCWCAAPETGIPYTNVVPLEMMKFLPCYNGNEVGDQYYRQCDSANNMGTVIRSLLRNHGTLEITLKMQNCNFDGSYHRVQTFKDKKKCVFVNNSPLTEAVASDDANCNCAYDRHVAMLRQSEFVMDCLPNGNYRNRQNWNGKVLCVDEDGFYYSKDPNECPE